MIISSELTGETYKTVEECLAAEASYKEKEEEKRKAAQRKRQELDEAYEEAITACDRYLKLAGIDYKILDEEPWATFKVKSSDPLDFSVIKELLGI